MRKRPTAIESEMAVVLRKLGVDFCQQYIIQPYIVDFYVPTFNTVIETDGAFHGKQFEKDSARQSQIEAKGFNVIRFSSKEMKYRPSVFKKLISYFQGLVVVLVLFCLSGCSSGLFPCNYGTKHLSRKQAREMKAAGFDVSCPEDFK